MKFSLITLVLCAGYVVVMVPMMVLASPFILAEILCAKSDS